MRGIQMNDFLTMSIVFSLFSLGLGINGVIMTRKVLSRNTEIHYIEKSRKLHFLGILAVLSTLFLYFIFDVPEDQTTFLGMLAIMVSYTFFAYFYRNMVAFYSKEGVFFNTKEIPYKKIDSYSVTGEDKAYPKITLRYRTESNKKKGEVQEQGTMKVEKALLTGFTDRLRKERVRKRT
ncbi:hypothetical protein KCG48_04780 [Proteiniclasticum sp. BAD-10]|uniref:Uncharacterized protein n=1 Tax=Proteiniclasticum sediminis TaxID=2804028 RepID=A0A941HPS4_9CLOT|nr:hypothetical protein [Proteiniclasticum sediminis]MBR0575654.1 hypothetical protein [Proteiniclasticum sediminis]